MLQELKTIRKNTIIIFTSLALGLCLLGCNDEVGTTPITVPGLFLEWELMRIETDCSQTGFNSTSVENPFFLDLNSDYTFSFSRRGQEPVTGRFIIDNDNITFIPPIYPESISTTYRYGFGGRILSTTTTELVTNASGVLETCEIRRLYTFGL